MNHGNRHYRRTETEAEGISRTWIHDMATWSIQYRVFRRFGVTRIVFRPVEPSVETRERKKKKDENKGSRMEMSGRRPQGNQRWPKTPPVAPHVICFSCFPKERFWSKWPEVCEKTKRGQRLVKHCVQFTRRFFLCIVRALVSATLYPRC